MWKTAFQSLFEELRVSFEPQPLHQVRTRGLLCGGRRGFGDDGKSPFVGAVDLHGHLRRLQFQLARQIVLLLRGLVLDFHRNFQQHVSQVGEVSLLNQLIHLEPKLVWVQGHLQHWA